MIKMYAKTIIETNYKFYSLMFNLELIKQGWDVRKSIFKSLKLNAFNHFALIYVKNEPYFIFHIDLYLKNP